MGVVDLALDRSGQPVALKRLALHGSAAEMANARQRIQREAQALGALDHPNIVPLLEVVDQDDDVVLVMPYLSGGSLTDYVRAHGPLTPAGVEYLADALLGALAAAHRAGIVHRDIKPGNVLFDGEGRPYLTDFGVATMRGATSGLTGTQMVIGTPEYMAPEQARGERATAASDVFALGATLRFAATGEGPFGHGDARVIVHRAAEGKVEPLPRSLPRELRRRLDRLVERRADRRPSAAAARGGGGDTHRLKAPTRRGGRAPGSRLWPAVVGLVIVAAVAVTATVVSMGHGRSPLAAPGSTAAAPAPASTAAPTTTCVARPYQPCGQPVAPFTNGVACVAGHADYDANPVNGCEAASDAVPGEDFDHTITANLVPANAAAAYPFHLSRHFHVLCDASVKVTLTAPAGVAMRLQVVQGSSVVGQAISRDGQPASVPLSPDDCYGNKGADLVAKVTWVGTARSQADFVLERHGSY
jgi:predicted Ser/Thr protein kinase